MDFDADGTTLFGAFHFRDLAENQTVARSHGSVAWIYGSTYRISNGISASLEKPLIW